jgi:mono/diheme cytochrome c family protein
MSPRREWGLVAVLFVAGTGAAATPNAEPSVERGKQALLGRCFVPASITPQAYDNVWKQWGLAAKPPAADYDRLFRERYGLHETPYPNGHYPMGLREATFPLGIGKGIGIDCLICHGGSITGHSYVGLGNSSLEIQAFFEETAAADGRPPRTPFRFGNLRGTNEAGSMAVFLLGYREPDLSVRVKPVDLELHDDLYEDPPAWWLLKKKKTMYHTGSTDTRSVRALMQFMLTPLNPVSVFDGEEATFADIRAYLLSLEAPKYPLPIDRTLAATGGSIFADKCARCHGTYGDKWTYPNRVVPLDEIGTDRHRFDGITAKFDDYYAKSWFAKDASYPPRGSGGYQAPPLDGVWATAPYFHNGSAPTVYHVLNSKARPRIYTRSYRTDLEAYDSRKLGWKIEELATSPDPNGLTPIEFRKVYDTTKSGRTNGGHTYGDKLTDEQRFAVIEYLKTL